MLTPVFEDTIEGNMAKAIRRWLQREHGTWVHTYALQNADKIEPVVYEAMGAKTWIESAHTEDSTFAYICSHDPRKMFNIAFGMALLSLRCELFEQDGEALITVQQFL